MDLSPRARLVAALWSLLLCVVVASPALPAAREGVRDSFPLSWYPMFASSRRAEEAINYVVGREANGGTRPIDVDYWSNGGGYNQARTQLDRALLAGPPSGRAFCARIAAAVAADPEAAVVGLEIHRSTFSRERFFRDGDPTPSEDRVLLTCPVGSP